MPTRALLTLFARSRTSITAAPRPRARRPLMRSTSSFFVRQRRAVSPSRPAILDGAARSGWSRLAGAHRRRRLGLDNPEHGATLGYRRASLLANLLSRTDDRVAKSRARGESPAAQPYCRSSFAAPVRAFGPLAFHPATKRA